VEGLSLKFKMSRAFAWDGAPPAVLEK